MPNFTVHNRQIEYSSRLGVLLRYTEEATIHDLDQGESPYAAMKQQVVHVMDKALQNARDRGINPLKIGFRISTPGLENPLFVPFRPLEQNNVDALMHAWDQIEQSHRELNIYQQRIELSITVYGSRNGGDRTVDGHKEDEFGVFHIFSPDGACLFRAAEFARLFALKDLSTKVQRKYLRDHPARLDKMIAELRADGLRYSLDQQSHDLTKWLPLIESFYNRKYGRSRRDDGELLIRRIRITVFDSPTNFKPFYQGKISNPTHDLLLYYHDDHCDVILNIRKFFNIRNFCIDCCSSFADAQRHTSTCKRKCTYCARVGIDRPCAIEYDEDGKRMRYPCGECNKTFSNYDCFQSHIERRICAMYRFCLHCGKCYNTKVREHKCNDEFCFTCRKYHADGKCYITTTAPKKTTELPPRIVSYDFETRQEDQQPDSTFKHIVNFAAAYSTCTKCLDSGEWKTDGFRQCCGTYKRIKTWNEAAGCEEPLEKFVQWLLKLSNVKKMRVYALAHYASRFDLILIIGELVRQKIDIKKIVANGNKVFQVVVKHRNGGSLIFKDSYLLFPLPLSDLPSTFNLDVEEKQWFPYLWNKRCNYNNPLPYLPPMENYSVDCMTEKKYAKFLNYYTENLNTPFDLKTELEEYGRNDVIILMHAVAAFRQIFLNETSIDMIENATTIASCCMLHFRTNVLKENTIAVVPETGYEDQTRQSSIALKYIKWFAHNNPTFSIRHRDSAGGEIKYKGYSVDAVIERDGQKPLALEINGCYFHGHLDCYEESDLLPNGRTAAANQKIEAQRLQTLAEAFEVQVVWTCEIERELKENREMREFFENCFDEGPITPRNAFFGGRCGPVEMYAKADADTEIVFYDIQSMYPFQQFTAEFPLHHPEIVVKDEDLSSDPWTKPEQIPYKGMIKCVVLPPERLRLPVLPLRVGHFLVFPLCRTCAHEQITMTNKETAFNCKHNSHQRSFVFEGTTFELAEALLNGYKVTRFFRAWHYPEWTTELFKPYVRQFLKAKMESKKCKYDEADQRANFEREIREHLQIDINTLEMKDNPGRRTVAKLCLNSHWGRFGIRNRMAQTEITTSTAKVISIFEDRTVEVGWFEFLPDDSYLIIYTKRPEYVKSGPSSNLVYASLTTSCARLQLYRIMKAIDETPGFSLIYTDTDSVILSKPRNAELPFEVGDRLGMMEKEMPDKEILEVVVAGNKQYAMQCRSIRDPTEVTTTIKIRGITFTKEAAAELSYERFKSMALNYDDDAVVKCSYRKIQPNKRGTVHTKDTIRSYRRYYVKGFVGEDLKVYPFGYKFQ